VTQFITGRGEQGGVTLNLNTAVEHSKIPFALSLSKGSGILECSTNG
jgi:hypothetical protein